MKYIAVNKTNPKLTYTASSVWDVVEEAYDIQLLHVENNSDIFEKFYDEYVIFRVEVEIYQITKISA